MAGCRPTILRLLRSRPKSNSYEGFRKSLPATPQIFWPEANLQMKFTRPPFTSMAAPDGNSEMRDKDCNNWSAPEAAERRTETCRFWLGSDCRFSSVRPTLALRTMCHYRYQPRLFGQFARAVTSVCWRRPTLGLDVWRRVVEIFNLRSATYAMLRGCWQRCQIASSRRARI